MGVVVYITEVSFLEVLEAGVCNQGRGLAGSSGASHSPLSWSLICKVGLELTLRSHCTLITTFKNLSLNTITF